ncbi:MAG: hypothetical protein JKY15_01345 [Deltaproteobacteria bacterium]|nr:hypothetical protein [Deltaproteobacteria bacterium]
MAFLLRKYRTVLAAALVILMMACSGQETSQINADLAARQAEICSQEPLNGEEARIRNDWVKKCYKEMPNLNELIPLDSPSYFLLISVTDAQGNAPVDVTASCELAKEFKIETICPVQNDGKGFNPSKYGLDLSGREADREQNIYVAKISEIMRKKAGEAGRWAMSFKETEYSSERLASARTVNEWVKKCNPDHPVVRLVEKINSIEDLKNYYELTPGGGYKQFLTRDDCYKLDHTTINPASFRRPPQ